MEENSLNSLPMPSWCLQKNSILILSLFVQPGAKTTEVTGIVGKELKIRIAAPSIEAKANTELIRYLSTLLKVPKSQIQIRRGHKSRHKIVEVNSYNIDEIRWITGSEDRS